MITGCYTNAAVNGSHAVVLQNGGTSCPSGTSAISWDQTGPQGPAGPAGAAGATGPAGPAGSSIVTSASFPPSPCMTAGDTDIDLADGEVYTCTTTGAAWTNTGSSVLGPQGPAGAGASVSSLASGNSNCANGGAQITDGNGNTAYACNGATGATGPQGPQGPAGTGGVISEAALNGIECTTGGTPGGGGAVGSLAVTTDSSNQLVFTCTALTTDPTCTHSDGLGDSYTDCNDIEGVPGEYLTYNITMATDAMNGWEAANPVSSPYVLQPQTTTANCGNGFYASWTGVAVYDGPPPNSPVTEFVVWVWYVFPSSTNSGGAAAGTVLVYPPGGGPCAGSTATATASSTGTWS